MCVSTAVIHCQELGHTRPLPSHQVLRLRFYLSIPPTYTVGILPVETSKISVFKFPLGCGQTASLAVSAPL